jgi:hypothetical protein
MEDSKLIGYNSPLDASIKPTNMKKLITIADVKSIYNRPDISDAQLAEFVRRLNVAANHNLNPENATVGEIADAMERWHLSRDNDSETLEKINGILYKSGHLLWFNEGSDKA